MRLNILAAINIGRVLWQIAVPKLLSNNNCSRAIHECDRIYGIIRLHSAAVL